MREMAQQGFPGHLPQNLAHCTSDAQRRAWVREKLRRGGVVTETGLWLAGINEPKALIRGLIRGGLRILTFRTKVPDAADPPVWHRVLAWRLPDLQGGANAIRGA
jgi:hypothetical protein